MLIEDKATVDNNAVGKAAAAVDIEARSGSALSKTDPTSWLVGIVADGSSTVAGSRFADCLKKEHLMETRLMDSVDVA